MRQIVNFFLLVAFVGTVSLHVFAERDRTRRNVEFLPDMAYSPAYDTYQPNPNFADGKTIQMPEPGTIPHDRLPLHYGPSFGDFMRAGNELSNPYSRDDASATERGAFIFRNYCQMCHGPQGKGDGPMAQHGMPLGPAASLLAEKAVPPKLPLKDGEMFHIITYGQKNMPSHAAQLTREDRWKVILHVRSLQEQAREKKP